jgi:hypothetical protein
MEQKTRLSGRVAARITSRGPALEMQEHGKSLLRNYLHPPKATACSGAPHRAGGFRTQSGPQCGLPPPPNNMRWPMSALVELDRP